MAKARRKGGLGRGLESILPDAVETPSTPTDVGAISISQIESVNPFQPRKDFDEQALEELTASIKLHGVIQPVTVRRLEPDKYQLIAGERRFRASKKAGLSKIPAYVITADNEQMLEFALIENIQRKDLNPLEIAQSYYRMIDELDLKQEELGEKVGKDRTTVTNFLRLLKLSDEIQKGIKDGQISMGHAKAIMGVDNKSRQLSVFYEIIDKSLSVRQAEKLARENKTATSKATSKSSSSKPSAHQIQLKKVEGNLEEKFGNKVKIKQNTAGKGDINISFNSTEDLNRILEILDI